MQTNTTERSDQTETRRYICSQEKAPVKTDTINQHNSTNVTVQRTQKGLRTRLVIDQLPHCSVYINIISLGLKLFALFYYCTLSFFI